MPLLNGIDLKNAHCGKIAFGIYTKMAHNFYRTSMRGNRATGRNKFGTIHLRIFLAGLF